jgi:adhesin transport system membrane fusion protein
MNGINGKHHFPMLWFLAIFIVLLVVAAAYFEIDQAVSSRGQIIPGSRTQVIQSVDGGMVVALHVREGDRVVAGQLLAELESDRAKAMLDQARFELASKQIAALRVRAEIAGTSPSYGSFVNEWPDLVRVQDALYAQRKLGFNEDVAAMKSSLNLAQSELSMSQRLYRSGDISETEVMRAQRQVIEIQARISATRNKYYQDAQTELAKLEDDMSVSRAKWDDRQSVLNHTSIRSPSDGVVKVVRLSTLGGVLKPGDELLQISPVDDVLVAEVKVNPADVGGLHVGLPVTVRFDALDSSIYGNVQGKITYISPDTLNEKGANDQPINYYRAEVALDVGSKLDTKISPEIIKPGMLVNADIRTGTRTVLYYLAKPIVKAFSGALAQR